MIRIAHAHLPVFAATHAGKSGKNNEDRYAVSAFQLSEADSTPVVFAVLADGIGGHRAGEVAAEMAVEGISQQVAGSVMIDPPQALTDAIHQTNQQIFSAAQSNDNRAGMGSTCVCALVINNTLFIATVGDSRIYLLRGDTILQLSTDHTWIQEALERGVLTPEQARNHPNQHVIRRYLGSPTPPLVDLRMRWDGEAVDLPRGLPLQSGDRLLLCSDGLTDLVSDAEILEILNGNEPGAALESLIAKANARGGHDNITLVLLHAPELTMQPPPPPAKRRFPIVQAAVGLGLLAILALILWGAFTLVQDFTRSANVTPTPGLTLSAPFSATGFATPLPLPDTTGTALPPTPSLAASPAPTRTAPPTLPVATITPWPTNTLKP